jgi:YD repeat-containing protein
MSHRAVFRSLLVVALSLVSRADMAAAQSPAIQYAYDELGRLVAVVDQHGNTAIYVYDEVGNVLSIERADAAVLPGVAITAVVPEKGKAGTVVSILGKGFGASQNSVRFNGVAALVGQASGNRIITAVPPGATTGPLTVTAPLGSATSPRSFRVIGALAVTPSTATLGPGATRQFVASDGGVETANVLWSVDGLLGGDEAVGAISPQGLYTAPATVASPRTVTVFAISRDDPSVVAAALVTLALPLPHFLAAAPVGVQVIDGGLGAVASGVGVQRASNPGALTIAAPVSVSVEPLITSLSPAAAVRGSASLALTMLGSGLAGVASVEFLRNNVVDTTLTVTGVTATADGTQLTAQVSIAASAPIGPRVVRARAGASVTTSVGLPGNVFTVQ